MASSCARGAKFQAHNDSSPNGDDDDDHNDDHYNDDDDHDHDDYDTVDTTRTIALLLARPEDAHLRPGPLAKLAADKPIRCLPAWLPEKPLEIPRSRPRF